MPHVLFFVAKGFTLMYHLRVSEVKHSTPHKEDTKQYER